MYLFYFYNYNSVHVSGIAVGAVVLTDGKDTESQSCSSESTTSTTLRRAVHHSATSSEQQRKVFCHSILKKMPLFFSNNFFFSSYLLHFAKLSSNCLYGYCETCNSL